jgi:hypothetical protein
VDSSNGGWRRLPFESQRASCAPTQRGLLANARPTNLCRPSLIVSVKRRTSPSSCRRIETGVGRQHPLRRLVKDWRSPLKELSLPARRNPPKEPVIRRPSARIFKTDTAFLNIAVECRRRSLRPVACSRPLWRALGRYNPFRWAKGLHFVRWSPRRREARRRWHVAPWLIGRVPLRRLARLPCADGTSDGCPGAIFPGQVRQRRNRRRWLCRLRHRCGQSVRCTAASDHARTVGRNLPHDESPFETSCP